MKLKNLIIPIVAGLCVLIAGKVQADVMQIVTINVTTYSQNTNYDNGTTTTFAPIKVKSHNTREILGALARDKNAQGLWPSNSFPATAKLAAGNDGFAVMNGTNILVDVSDIIHFGHGESESNNPVRSGRENDITGLASPTVKKIQIGRITFDDTAIVGGVNLKFYLQGLVRQSETDTTPTVSGVYTQTKSGQVLNAAGEGVDSDGNTFFCTGTITATGHGTQTLN